MAAKVEPLQDEHGNAPPLLVGAVQTDDKAELNAHGLSKPVVTLATHAPSPLCGPYHAMPVPFAHACGQPVKSPLVA